MTTPAGESGFICWVDYMRTAGRVYDTSCTVVILVAGTLHEISSACACWVCNVDTRVDWARMSS